MVWGGKGRLGEEAFYMGQLSIYMLKTYLSFILQICIKCLLLSKFFVIH